MIYFSVLVQKQEKKKQFKIWSMKISSTINTSSSSWPNESEMKDNNIQIFHGWPMVNVTRWVFTCS